MYLLHLHPLSVDHHDHDHDDNDDAASEMLCQTHNGQSVRFGYEICHMSSPHLTSSIVHDDRQLPFKRSRQDQRFLLHLLLLPLLLLLLVVVDDELPQDLPQVASSLA